MDDGASTKLYVYRVQLSLLLSSFYGVLSDSIILYEIGEVIQYTI